MIASALFGGPTYMSCKVADDADGDIYVADLEAAGVDHCLNGERSAGTTGKCLVLITPDAERSMNTFLGISETLSTEQLDANAIAASEYLYLEGYLVTSPTGRAAAIRAREIAESVGDITSATADQYCSYDLVTLDQDGISIGSSWPANIMVACDKDGSNGDVTETSFGGNHGGDGGNILRGDGSAKWISADRWSTNIWGEADLAAVSGF